MPEYLIESKIQRSIFPRLEEITSDDNLYGYVIKYNISENYFILNKKKNIINKII